MDMTRQELINKLNQILQDIKSLDNVTMSGFAARKLIAAEQEIELAVKFLELK